jgi:polysaccharide deacetylase 2 family uncharacterized protein YibQ
MADDELNRPLGGRSARRPFPVRLLATSAVALLLIGGAGFLYLHGDPLGGEPHAIALITHPAPPAPAVAPATTVQPASGIDTQPTGAIAKPPSSAVTIEQESGVKVVRGGDAAPPAAEIINVPKLLAQRLAPAPDSRLVELGRYGPLPRIGKNGARPADVYARPFTPAGNVPRIALVVGGVGLSDSATAQAIESLPGQVTLAFAPYGSDLQGKVSQARNGGHEVILQLPMEPLDPNLKPGSHMLSSTATAAENADDLHWLLSRFTGYTGVANFLGGRLTTSPSALQPILREIGTRGLFYLDDGSAPQSIALSLAKDTSLPAAGVDVILDASSAANNIDARWAKLEAIARSKGVAIGMVSDLPPSLENLARFAQTATAHGFVLVPLSAAINTATPVAATSSQEGAFRDP